MAQANGEDVQLLPWPSEWKTPGGTKLTVGILAFGTLGVIAGILGITHIATGTFNDSTIILLAGALFVIALSVATTLLRIRVRRRGVAAVHTGQNDREFATVIPNSRGVWLMTIAALSAGLIIFGLVALISWVSVLFVGDTSAQMLFQTLLSTVFVVGISWFFLRTQQESITQGSLQLTSTGVTYKSLGPQEHASWGALLHIFPSPGDAPDIVLGIDPSRTTSTSKKQILRVSGAFLSIDPALAYHALLFYLHHPESRSELGTERSVERIRQANFSE